ncbi:hypothetical protein G7Y89_g6110 [Cudoniella acicularis]|uniref:BTB domain-containing protein n=1 Tax=Cudoniella acicularis TaxID=354080 RepID=A0A8H4RNJ1_9HELO|nr:hypothetical protein G7Y89_g6110 [Cudoniella acicularis]
MSSTESSAYSDQESDTTSSSAAAAAPNTNFRTNHQTEVPQFKNPCTFVTFKVGKFPILEDFMVHQEVACHASVVFAAAFTSPFLESQLQTFCVEDFSPCIFRLLMQWMYAKTVSLPSDLSVENRYIYLVNLFHLADCYLMTELQHVATNMLWQVFKDTRVLPSRALLKECWIKTNENSKLRMKIFKIAWAAFLLWKARPYQRDPLAELMPSVIIDEIFCLVCEQVEENQERAEKAGIYKEPLCFCKGRKREHKKVMKSFWEKKWVITASEVALARKGVNSNFLEMGLDRRI